MEKLYKFLQTTQNQLRIAKNINDRLQKPKKDEERKSAGVESSEVGRDRRTGSKDGKPVAACSCHRRCGGP